ncbi:MAG: YbaK/EbsC family protein [bacterium]|nr:YbaK/EbsC family protein [bacterium]
MNLQLGTLKISPVSEHLDLLGKPVADALLNFPEAGEIGVAEIDPTISDTAIFCETYHIPIKQAANCVVLEAKREDKSWFAACVILGSTRADVNGLARKALDVRRLSFAPMEKALTATGMEYGAITPLGLPSDWIILIDKAVIDTDIVTMGSGYRKSKLVLPGRLLASLPNVKIVEGLGKAVV